MRPRAHNAPERGLCITALSQNPLLQLCLCGSFSSFRFQIDVTSSNSPSLPLPCSAPDCTQPLPTIRSSLVPQMINLSHWWWLCPSTRLEPGCSRAFQSCLRLVGPASTGLSVSLLSSHLDHFVFFFLPGLLGILGTCLLRSLPHAQGFLLSSVPFPFLGVQHYIAHNGPPSIHQMPLCPSPVAQHWPEFPRTKRSLWSGASCLSSRRYLGLRTARPQPRWKRSACVPLRSKYCTQIVTVN